MSRDCFKLIHKMSNGDIIRAKDNTYGKVIGLFRGGCDIRMLTGEDSEQPTFVHYANIEAIYKHSWEKRELTLDDIKKALKNAIDGERVMHDTKVFAQIIYDMVEDLK